MSNKLMLALVLFIGSYKVKAQNADKILHARKFIQVWGFIKYHHAGVANGTVDWDSVFLQNIPSLLMPGNSGKFNSTVQQVLDIAGSYPLLKKQKYPDSLFLLNETNTDWFEKSDIFSSEVKIALRHINNNRNPDSNRYIKMIHNTADFSGEKKFEEIDFPDTAHRLLFLSRFWNIINYFAPYKYLASDWDKVLDKFVPKMMKASDNASYYKTLQELCKSLNDGHAGLVIHGQFPFQIFFGKNTIPLYCEIINDTVVVRGYPNDSIAQALNIQKGDVIIKVDGESIAKVINQYGRYISASNKLSERSSLSRFILDGNSLTASLEIKRGKTTIKVNIKRIPGENKNWWGLLNYTSNDVGYKILRDSILLIYAAQIRNENTDTIKQLMTKSKAVIFDVRNYPASDDFFNIAGPFLPEPKTIEYSTIALPNFPGLFRWLPNPNKIGYRNDSAFMGKVVILCDERTQSQGEYSCMVLQTTPQAVTIGSQTAGCDGVVTYIPMGGGITLSYSGYGVYYPDKRQTQMVGVKVDIPVIKTIDAVRNNKDEILERAVRYIDTNE